MKSDIRSRTAGTTGAAAVIALATIPVLLLVVWSFSRGWFWPALLPAEWSLRAWRYVADPGAEVAPSLLASFGLASAVTIASLLIALPAARALAWHDFRGKRAVFFGLLLPVLAPPLASAMGVHALFLEAGIADTWVGVMLVHLIPAAPYTTMVLTGSFSRFDPEYEAQARTLGAGPFAIWRRVTLPAIAPGLAVAAVFAFLISWSQYLLTLLVGGSGVRTLPLILVSFQRSGDEAVTAALSLVFIAPAIVVFILAARFMKNSLIHEDTRRDHEE
ncbi:MAG: ABC transporter permease [Blastocatellales bacterium]